MSLPEILVVDDEPTVLGLVFHAPEMCGPELVKKITQLCPTTAVVMMSGHVGAEGLPGHAGFIGKPFLVTDLYSVVERALAGSQNGLDRESGDQG